MITRCVAAAALVLSVLATPAYAADQGGMPSASSGPQGSTPEVSRGSFPHRSSGHAETQGLLLAGGALGMIGLVAGLSGGSGNGGGAPPVSAQ
jgi:hypothetical protein